ncbi:MAG TPA: hypothetical protein VGB91_17875 [Rhizomicrobium sp.]
MPVPEADKPLLWRRLQDYIAELMPYDGGAIPADGVFTYPDFDLYGREAGRFAFWAMADGERAAFALVHRAAATKMAEFYSFPEFRRAGVALPFAQAVIRRFPGPWELTQFRANEGAVAFWRRAIADWPFEEDVYTGAQSGKARLRQSFIVPG